MPPQALGLGPLWSVLAQPFLVIPLSYVAQALDKAANLSLVVDRLQDQVRELRAECRRHVAQQASSGVEQPELEQLKAELRAARQQNKDLQGQLDKSRNSAGGLSDDTSDSLLAPYGAHRYSS